MKKIILYIIFSIFSIYVSAQTFDVEVIKYSGAEDKRINLVILSDGYQVGELDKFITDATIFTNAMFGQSPFLEYANYFNVYAIKVPSNESGADHPANATDVNEMGATPVFVDTYFNATFDSFGFHRLLYYEIDGNNANNTHAKIISVLADNFPMYDQALILVNSPYYGGSGGEFPMASTHVDGKQIAIHELGHSLFNLKDEYLLPDIFYAEAINMTQETNTSLVKWKNWIGTNGVNIFPYGNSGIPSTWYKPRHQKCKMEVLNETFCSVCKEGMIEKIHSLISPIDSYTPNEDTVNNPSFPLSFQLNLIKPTPNTLESVWTLNANNFGNNVDDVSILETNLVEGANTLTTVVTDATSLLKVDNHETLHLYTITWTINYSTLGVYDITNEVNNFNITMFPNPSNDIINFKIESSLNSNLKLDIISIDGKKLHAYTLLNSEEFQVDMSTWSKGVYIAKIYANNALIANKKLVKN